MGDPLPQGGLVLSVEHIAEGSIIIPMGQEMVIAPQSPNMMILGIRPNADSPIMVEPNKV
jgi:hypothetical protein